MTRPGLSPAYAGERPGSGIKDFQMRPASVEHFMTTRPTDPVRRDLAHLGFSEAGGPW
ncbi:hypothetical protein EDD29_4323 [Actinocorallia herbida]|uniref:Uncharacterized protein n=1 Tax=Actinocorallia herbida TaxID=58109 RepID=A0A3N1CZM9_9ACTN|nr:hypothetical protein EDD29_4323 [Actinocorallia herbida]